MYAQNTCFAPFTLFNSNDPHHYLKGFPWHPHRRSVSGEIPEVTLKGDIRVKVICGQVGGVKGPVQDVVVDPAYLDVNVPPERRPLIAQFGGVIKHRSN